MMRLNRQGFTLVEIMIVVAIIALLAAIAIPNLLRARLSANQSAAVASLKTLVVALESFNASNAAYPTTAQGLNELGPAVSNPPYIDAALAGATAAATARQGYWYTYSNVDAGGGLLGYFIDAAPATAGTTGDNFYYVDESGVIWFLSGGPAAGAHANPAGTSPGAGWAQIQ